jgi:hypothetical protein
MDKFNALGTGEKLIVIGGAVMLIASFLPWFNIGVEGVPGANASESGWGEPGQIRSLLAVFLSVAMAGIIAAVRVGNVQLPNLPEGLTWGKVWGGAAALLVVLMLPKAWRIIAVDAPEGIDAGFDFGFLVALVATGLLVAGGYLLYSEEQGGFSRRTTT